MRQRPQSFLVPEVEQGEWIGITGCILFGAIVALAAAVGVGLGLWILVDRILTMLGG